MKFIKSIIAPFLIILFPSMNQANTIDLDQVIAIVNSEAITRSEYETRYRRQQLQVNQAVGEIPEDIDENLLGLLIDERIQVQAAYANGITVSRAEIENILSDIAQQNNLTAQQLIDDLAAQGVSPGQSIRSIEEQALIQRVVDMSVNSRVTVSEQEIDYHLQAHKEIYATDKSYEISHLYIFTSGKSESETASELENMQHIHQRLQLGHDFAASVENFSDGNKENGGYLGWRKEDQLPELFLGALRDTPIGGVTDILHSANGFHIIKLHSKQGEVQIVTQQLVRHILLQPLRHNMTSQEVIAFMQDIADKVRAGGDFAQFARLHSDDRLTAPAGGNMGWISPGDVAPELEKAALDLPLNTLSEPVQSRFGFHLVEVLERREKDISNDLVRNAARQEIYKRKAANLYKSWFNQLRESAYIEFIEN